MKSQNEVKISFPSRSSNESFARMAVSSFFAQLDPTVDEIADIKTAVSEAVTNAIVHGYPDRLGTVWLHLKILEGRVAYIKIRDNGCGIPDIPKAMEPLYTTAPGEDRAGLGFSVMESFMDKLKVLSHPGKGTTVILQKKIGEREQHG